MGQYGSAQVVYGWHINEEDIEKIERVLDAEEDDWLGDVIYDWAEENDLDFDAGGNPAYNWNEYIVGVKINPWISDLGVHEIPDNFGEVDYSVHEKLKPFVDFFGREPRKHLVMSYG